MIVSRGRGAGARTLNKGFGDLRDTISLHPYAMAIIHGDSDLKIVW